VPAYVLDTDVLVAAMRSGTGASRGILSAALARRFELLISVPLMLEYEAVLKRPEHLRASGTSAEDVGDVLDVLSLVGKRVTFAFRWRPALPDPNDDMVLETAINGNADAIVTFNERHFNPVAGRFGCQVMRPGEALRMLGNDTDE
jgi:putative PIN family toxin of toxin-antitoxin system